MKKVLQRFEEVPEVDINLQYLTQKNVDMDWQGKSLSYCPTILDKKKKVPENGQDIRQSHYIHHGSHEKLESGIDTRR